MRSFLFVAMILVSASGAHAQDRARPTPQEAAEGWFSLFDGTSTFGWNVEGSAVAKGGRLTLAPKTKLTTTVPFPEMGFRVEQVGGGDYAAPTDGKLQPFVFWAKETEASVVRLHVQPKNMKPLFNGTNLEGWTIFPGKKSTFVVKDGAIVVKDGPGDLQTVGKFKNFLLQLECKSHGKHLNSGVFFRCRAGEYQNGYEAQIRNQFTDDATQDYAVEDYDPATRKLKEKRKVKSRAVDFGTGAIYRRVPARSSVAKDGEWFTLTVLAQGNRFATWVDGVQQVDWTDNRPLSDNARTGCKLEAGHISFQGHDPTTHLSFRNIRIVELK